MIALGAPAMTYAFQLRRRSAYHSAMEDDRTIAKERALAAVAAEAILHHLHEEQDEWVQCFRDYSKPPANERA